MRTLHIAPGDSAGGSIREAVRSAGRNHEVLRFLDDLSCGPIDSDDPSARAAWWAQFSYKASESEARFRQFWDRVASADNHIVVWFGRHSAQELAFFLAWADRLGERPYEIIDVTGRRLAYRRRDGSPALSRPIQRVSIMQPETLRSLLGTERPITAEEIDKSRRDWRRLRTENAPFRIVTEAGLTSTSADHFDPLLLAQATPEWQPVLRIVADTIGYTSEPYDQVGNVMLWARLVTLVDAGRLVADGDPWEIPTRVRLPHP